ncbi:uncharacterized protein [Diadema setosum]|uniref:uncharacterized protein n=1 Tax=Diadema setosum TaxID=31175 RepID=UPI003B3ACDCB
MEKYSYRKVLGAGNYGKAWLVRSRESNRPYVVKEINVSCMGEKDREQAVNEVAILGRLKHVNIIRYREAFVAGAGGVLGIVMEYADGGDLAEKIEAVKSSGGKFVPSQIINWFVQLCLALHYMHSEKILHRDLKPSNLFLTTKGLVKVGDFGIAKVLLHTLDHALTSIGTPYYLSPEICQRQPYNQKSDMWAAGCILYELTTLRHPFDGPDFSTLVLRILRASYTPIPIVYGSLLHELIAVLLSVNPSERPSAQDVLTASSMRPYVKAYTDRRLVVDHSPSPRTNAARPAVRPKSPMYRKMDVRMSSIHTKSPLPTRNRHSAVSAGKTKSSKLFSDPSPCPSTNKIQTSTATSAGMSRRRTPRQCKADSSSRRRIVHGHSASDPVKNFERCYRSTKHHNTPPPKITTLQRLPQNGSAGSSKVPQQSQSSEVAAVNQAPSHGKSLSSLSCKNDQRIHRRYDSERESRSSRTTTKRRSCTPVFNEPKSDVLSSIQQSTDSAVPDKKRRRSLPERVRDSRFLTRLVSSERKSYRVSKRKSFSKPETTTKTSGLYSARKSPESVPSSVVQTRASVANSAPSATTRGGGKMLSSRPRSQSETRMRSRNDGKPRGAPRAPITCLFPATPKTSSKPRSLVKHGTYTLQLPEVFTNPADASTRCGRCGCQQGKVSNTKLLAVSPHKRTQSDSYKSKESDRRPASDVSKPSEVPDWRQSKEQPQRGIFSRRNAIRRPSRDYVQKTKLQRRRSQGVAFENPQTGPIPDIIPSVGGDSPFSDAMISTSRSRDNFLKCEGANGDERDIEVAEFLHAGMVMEGELTTDLRAKLELLKMYLERRLGADRTVVAYDIMTKAREERSAAETEAKWRPGSPGSSEDVVKLVAEVLGPGKMKYFPILLQAFDLSNRCN